MQNLGKQLVKLAKEDRRELMELLNNNYEGDSMIVFSAVGEQEGSGDQESYCYDCGAIGKAEDFCHVCRSAHLSRGEIIEAIEVIALDNGDYADIRDAAQMADHDE